MLVFSCLSKFCPYYVFFRLAHFAFKSSELQKNSRYEKIHPRTHPPAVSICLPPMDSSPIGSTSRRILLRRLNFRRHIIHHLSSETSLSSSIFTDFTFVGVSLMQSFFVPFQSSIQTSYIRRSRFQLTPLV